MVGNVLRVLPIVDEILKDFHGRIVNSVELGDFTFGKELQLHVMEIKPNAPFRSPETFEENMQARVAWKNALQQERKYLPIVRKRIDNGSLSEIIRERVEMKTQKTGFREAVITVYSKLAESLIDNRPYF